jgi:hypothetical protein
MKSTSGYTEKTKPVALRQARQKREKDFGKEGFGMSNTDDTGDNHARRQANPRRVLVCGGRDFNDWDWMNETLTFYAFGASVIIHGGARGADKLAGDWARASGTRCEVFPAHWQLHGRRAGPIRNQQMIDEGKPDLVIAFPGGNGTADMVKRAVKAGIELVQPFA